MKDESLNVGIDQNHLNLYFKNITFDLSEKVFRGMKSGVVVKDSKKYLSH